MRQLRKFEQLVVCDDIKKLFLFFIGEKGIVLYCVCIHMFKDYLLKIHIEFMDEIIWCLDLFQNNPVVGGDVINETGLAMY